MRSLEQPDLCRAGKACRTKDKGEKGREKRHDPKESGINVLYTNASGFYY